jgi:hypothetical protein
MVDKSNYPCRNCGHRQNDHGKHFGLCYACEDNKKMKCWTFERIGNLEFLEWILNQKESKDER